MTKYKVKNNPLHINGEVYSREAIVEMEDDKAKAFGEDLEKVKKEKERDKKKEAEAKK